MRVRIHEARQNDAALRVDDVVLGGDLRLDFGRRADGFDVAVADEYRAIRNDREFFQLIAYAQPRRTSKGEQLCAIDDGVGPKQYRLPGDCAQFRNLAEVLVSGHEGKPMTKCDSSYPDVIVGYWRSLPPEQGLATTVLLRDRNVAG